MQQRYKKYEKEQIKDNNPLVNYVFIYQHI
jgi:hypothetical protein